MTSNRSEFEIRREAIQRYEYLGHKPKRIIKDLGKTRGWWDYVLKCYRKSGVQGLEDKPRGYPKGMRRKFHYNLRKQVKEIRERLENSNREYFYGAEAILMELEDLKIPQNQLPSVRYVKKILKEEGCVEKTRTLKRKEPRKSYPEQLIKRLSNLTEEMDFVGYKLIENYPYPLHFLSLFYRELQYGEIKRIRAEKTLPVMEYLIEHWKTNPLPDLMKLDNDAAFIGSGSAKKSLGKLIKFLLNLNVIPLFVPQSSPWALAKIEGSHSVFNKKVWTSKKFLTPQEIDQELENYNQKLKEYKLRKFKIEIKNPKYLPPDFKLTPNLYSRLKNKRDKFIYFIRLVHEENGVSLINVLNQKIYLEEEYNNHYVFTKLNIEKEELSVYLERNGQPYLVRRLQFKVIF